MLANFTSVEAALVDEPIFRGAVDEGTGPDRLVLFATWVMGLAPPNAGDFTVHVGIRGPFTPSGITRLVPQAGVTFLSLQLPTSVLVGETVTLDYVPGPNELRDQNGDPIGAFSGMDISVSVAAVPTRATPAGSNIAVTPADSTTGASLVSLTFDSVTAPGSTTLTTSEAGPALPGALSLGDPPLFFDLDTDATFAGEVEICISYGLVDFTDEANLVLLHFDGGAWAEVPLTLHDTDADLLCGLVTSLSPFTVAQSAFHFSGFFPPVENPPTVNWVNAGRAITIKFSLGGNVGRRIFAHGSPAVRRVDCLSGVPLGGEEAVRPGSSSLTYTPRTDRYQFVWETKQAWAGTCRELVIELTDTTVHVARFKFTR